MTMQVGMIGCNGIVLASDTKWELSFSAMRNDELRELREEYGDSKILISPTATMAIARAQKMIPATAAANKIMSDWKPEDEDAHANNLRRLVQPLTERESFECIIATSQPKLSLFRVLYAYAEGNGSLLVHRALDRVCAGDHANASQFWHLRYYDRSRPVSELKRLAAQIVVDAASMNSGAICGLEMVTLDESGVHPVEGGECSEMETEAKNHASEISKLIFSPRTQSNS